MGLQKLHVNGVHHATTFTKLIAAYAGVQMGPEVALVLAAARNLP
jgi:hypothetical protein